MDEEKKERWEVESVSALYVSRTGTWGTHLTQRHTHKSRRPAISNAIVMYYHRIGYLFDQS